MENTLAVPAAEVCLGVKAPTESEIVRETSPFPTRFFSVAEPISMEDVPEEMVRTAPASEIASSAAPSIDVSDTTTIDFWDWVSISNTKDMLGEEPSLRTIVALLPSTVMFDLSLLSTTENSELVLTGSMLLPSYTFVVLSVTEYEP